MLNYSLTYSTLVRLARSLACVLALSAVAILACGKAHAYDLSRAYETGADRTERGFVVGSVGLWIPGFGSFHDYHQLSLDYGVEFGFRIASIRGEHNIYVVGGFSLSPQLLDPTLVREDRRDTLLFLGYVGVRYLPGMLCVGDGLGCPFVELRFGAVFEASEDGSGHDGPNGTFTVLPGVGYRLRLGSSFQLGVRADLSFTEEYDRDLGWVELTTFLGFGW